VGVVLQSRDCVAQLSIVDQRLMAVDEAIRGVKDLVRAESRDAAVAAAQQTVAHAQLVDKSALDEHKAEVRTCIGMETRRLDVVEHTMAMLKDKGLKGPGVGTTALPELHWQQSVVSGALVPPGPANTTSNRPASRPDKASSTFRPPSSSAAAASANGRHAAASGAAATLANTETQREGKAGATRQAAKAAAGSASTAGKGDSGTASASTTPSAKRKRP
jgi:hypothetical protein